MLEKYPGDVKLVIKHFPTHSFSREAAIAALAAGKQGKFWQMHEKLLASQAELNDAKVESIARELGLKMEQFNRDLKDPGIESLIDRDFGEGRQANIDGTPTVFVNGKELSENSLQAIRQAIETELKKNK